MKFEHVFLLAVILTLICVSCGGGSSSKSTPAPPAVAMPPAGPFAKSASNPIIPIGDPGNGSNLLAEDLVYDSVSGHYWLVFSSYHAGFRAALAYSDTPWDPTSYHWVGPINGLTGNPMAPHLIQSGDTWYLFYYGGGATNDIYVSTLPASGGLSVNGWTNVAMPVLTHGTAHWDLQQDNEPYVFQRQDGVWVLMYMGNPGDNDEQVSFATSSSITGPYTKANVGGTGPGVTPFIANGPAGSDDARIVSDPWVVYFGGTYYIGYTCSPDHAPVQTCYATTTDWVTVTKQGILLPLSQSGWDSTNSFRGAVIRVSPVPSDPTQDLYVLPYTGGTIANYEMGVATQPVYGSH